MRLFLIVPALIIVVLAARSRHESAAQFTFFRHFPFAPLLLDR